VIDRKALTGSVNFVGENGTNVGAETGGAILARRQVRSDLAADPLLPDDTRLWAALQDASGGTWGGCVFDVDAIVKTLSAGRRNLES
jgi:hypothetical protein